MRYALIFLCLLLTLPGFSQTPTITSITESGHPGALVNIEGTNFSATPSDNIVFFGKQPALVFDASPTLLTVYVPPGAISNEFITVEVNHLIAYSPMPFKVVFPSVNTLTDWTFYPSAELSTGSNSHPKGVAVGDLDGDGMVDIVVANAGGSGVSIFRNTSGSYGLWDPARWDPWNPNPWYPNPPPSLADKIDFATGPNPLHVAIGDLDNDGKLDLAVANGNSVSLLRNTSTPGSLSFANKIDVLGASSSTAIGDLDGDGYSDLAVATSSNVVVLKNFSTVGDIGFAMPVPVAGPALSVAIGDLDGDEKLDLATNSGELLYNTSTPGTIAFVVNSGPGGPTNVLIADNGTVIGIPYTSEVHTPYSFATLDNSSSIAVIDFDGDGYLDIASSKVSVIKNMTHSYSPYPPYSSPVSFTVGTTGSNSVAVGDINGDGLPDLVVSSYDDNTISVLTNTVPPPLPPAPVITDFSPVSGNIGSSVTINGYNFSYNPSENIVFFGATQAAVTSASFYQLVVKVPSGATYNPISVEVHGQQATSALAFDVTFPSRQTIDTKSFGSPINLNTGSNPKGVAFKDLDGDGKPDLVVANRDASTISIFKNNSAGGTISSSSFDLVVELDAGGVPYGIDVDDIDGDGNPDIAVALGNGFSVFANRGCLWSGLNTWCLSNRILYFNSTTNESSRGNIVIEDLNGDGKPEIITSGNTTVSVFKNSTYIWGGLMEKSFDAPIDFHVGSQTNTDGIYHNNYVAVGDIDGDGKSDLAVTSSDDNTISVFKNSGWGGEISFYSADVFPTSTAPSTVAIDDLDGDGKLDLVTSNAQTISILRNKNSYIIDFDTKVDLTTTSPTNVAVSDIDGDGKPDLVVSYPYLGALANYQDGQPLIDIFKNKSVAGSITLSSFTPKAGFSNHQITNTFIAAGDLNGDSRPDLVITSVNNTLSILENTVPLIAPVATAATQIDLTSFTANWNSVGGATGYQIDVSTDNFNTFVSGYSSKAEASTSDIVIGLAAGVDYQYRIRAVAGSSISDNSNVINVTTLPVPVPVATNATNISGTNFTANWSSIAEATGYQLDISIDNFNTFVSGYHSKIETGTSANVIGLTPGVAYQYRVRATIGSSASANSNLISATTLFIPIPVATNATNILGTSFAANWNSVTGATSYQLDISSDDFVTFIINYNSKSVSDLTELINGLSLNTSYKYRVRAVTPDGTSSNSNVVLVKTLDKQSQTISFAAITDVTIGDPSIVLSATATSGLVISFESKITPAALTGNTFKIVLPGRDTIIASQPGNSIYESAKSVFRTFCINPAKPVITISNNNTATPILTSSANIGNQWSLNGVAISGATNKTLTIASPGVYSVQVKVDDCISKPSDNFPVIVTGELSESTPVRLYPNPGSDFVYITGIADLTTMSATDLLGRNKFISVEHLTDVIKGDVRDLPSGMYIIEIVDGKENHQLKFIKL